MPPVSRTDMMNCGTHSDLFSNQDQCYFCSYVPRFAEIDQTNGRLSHIVVEDARRARETMMVTGSKKWSVSLILNSGAPLGSGLVVMLRLKWHCVPWRSCFNNQ